MNYKKYMENYKKYFDVPDVKVGIFEYYDNAEDVFEKWLKNTLEEVWIDGFDNGNMSK